MDTENGGLTNVECPDCSCDVNVSLPRSADIVSVIAHPQNGAHDTDRTESERTRENQTQCTNGHTVSILYEW